MNETCKICGKEVTPSYWSTVKIGQFDGDKVHISCRDRTIADAIAKRPKEPTLEEQLRVLLNGEGYWPTHEAIAKVIATVREHYLQFLAGSEQNIQWQKRAEAAEAKLAAIR